jgi:hypothetical protein
MSLKVDDLKVGDIIKYKEFYALIVELKSIDNDSIVKYPIWLRDGGGNPFRGFQNRPMFGLELADIITKINPDTFIKELEKLKI